MLASAPLQGSRYSKVWGQEQEEEWADFLITGYFLRRRPQTFEYRDP